jgi:hypothetical protein
MKNTYILFDDLQTFDTLSELQQRLSVVDPNAPKYRKCVCTISDLDGKGWYIGVYATYVKMSSTGKLYRKTECTGSCTYKNRKLYGDPKMLECLKTHESKFQWLEKCSFSTLPDSIVFDILDGKITSMEQMWKTIAKRSYKDSHWKVTRWCKHYFIPMMYLKLVCPNYEAVITADLDLDLFRDLIVNAVALQKTISATWSHARMESELEYFRHLIMEDKLSLMDNNPIWNNPMTLGDFKVVNTERDAFATSEDFHNCVYRNYWDSIKRKSYIVFRSKEFCVGYQVLDGEDVLLDQIRGKYNTTVPHEKQVLIDTLLRPYAQKLVAGQDVR